jgi:hypothetical protein
VVVVRVVLALLTQLPDQALLALEAGVGLVRQAVVLVVLAEVVLVLSVEPQGQERLTQAAVVVVTGEAHWAVLVALVLSLFVLHAP